MSSPATAYLREVIKAQKNGRAVGIMSVCSANRFVIEAAMHQAKTDDTVLLVESTANQVNQFGGYAGMTPKEFAAFVREIARTMNFQEDRILLGGDHIGPGPWQSQPAKTAMEHALTLVGECVEAGYKKIHLDASMPCADDNPADEPHLPVEAAARRTAHLCRAAEKAFAGISGRSAGPLYVIGTDVPIPGGAYGKQPAPWVSRTFDVTRTIAETKKSFIHYGLESAWRRTVAVVVQPGMDFGPEAVVAYDRKRVQKLVSQIKSDNKFVFEAHATDYQSSSALREMVEDGFAILKVGPALTFAFREALTALSMIEAEIFAGRRGVRLSNLRDVLENEMQKDPAPWIKYHRGEDADSFIARYYSFSDRVRYYWPRPKVEASIQKLMANLVSRKLPLPLISQYLPNQYEAVREKRIRPIPEELIRNKIMEVTDRYSAACRSLTLER